MFTQVTPLIKKEIAYFFHSPIAYISIGLVVVVLNWLYFANFFLVNEVSMRSFFQNITLVYLLFVPAISMTSFAEEKRVKTMEILFTLPLTKLQIVLGKFLGTLTVLIFALLLTLTIPLTLSLLGQPEWGPVVTGYLSSVLLGGLFLSIGLYVSSLTDNQIVSFTVTAVTAFVLFITGSAFFLDRMPALILPFLRLVSVTTHFENMAKGVIDFRDLVYFVSLTGLFLYLTVNKIKKNN